MPATPLVRGRRLQGSEGVLPTDWLLGTPSSQQSSEAFVSGLQAIEGRFRGAVPLVRPESAVAPAAPPRAAPALEFEILPLSADSPPESSTPPQPSIAQPPPLGKETSRGEAAPPLRGSKGAIRLAGTVAARPSAGAGPSQMATRRALNVLQHMPTAALLRLPLELNTHHGQQMRRGFYKQPRPRPSPAPPPATITATTATTATAAIATATATATASAVPPVVAEPPQPGVGQCIFSASASAGWSSPGSTSPSGSPRPAPHRLTITRAAVALPPSARPGGSAAKGSPLSARPAAAPGGGAGGRDKDKDRADLVPRPESAAAAVPRQGGGGLPRRATRPPAPSPQRRPDKDSSTSLPRLVRQRQKQMRIGLLVERWACPVVATHPTGAAMGAATRICIADNWSSSARWHHCHCRCAMSRWQSEIASCGRRWRR